MSKYRIKKVTKASGRTFFREQERWMLLWWDTQKSYMNDWIIEHKTLEGSRLEVSKHLEEDMKEKTMITEIIEP
jgi:hypothetical protein